MTYETYAILLVNHAIEYFTVHLKRVWAKQERVKFHWAAICHEIVFREKCKATWKRGSIRKKKKKKKHWRPRAFERIVTSTVRTVLALIILSYSNTIHSVVCSLVSSTLHHLTIRLTHEFDRRTVHLGATRYELKSNILAQYPLFIPFIILSNYDFLPRRIIGGNG